MHLVVISHKETWLDTFSTTGFSTIGGFPFQMQALAELFDRTTVLVPVRSTPLPGGATSLLGHNLHVHPLPEPVGRDLRRKLSLLTWLPRHLPTLWGAVAAADAVHAPVPGDVGALGILVALTQRKPLFVRHCGTWGDPTTLADRFLDWLLPRIADGQRNVVMATGGESEPPSATNPHITWIFSTTLTRQELLEMPQANPWQPGEPLRLVTVGRLSPAKNTAAIIQAMPAMQEVINDLSLAVVGDGEARPTLERLAGDLSLSDRVQFHGNLPHGRVLEILAASHLFVFPTNVREGFPKALLEAMACGLPSIATRVSVIPHLLNQGCGLLLDQTDPQAVAQAVLTLTADPESMAEMATSARHVALNYSLERWRDLIGERLNVAWGPLQSSPGVKDPAPQQV